MDVPFSSSGAMGRAHYALVRKVESATPQAADQILLAEVNSVQNQLMRSTLTLVSGLRLSVSICSLCFVYTHRNNAKNVWSCFSTARWRSIRACISTSSSRSLMQSISRRRDRRRRTSVQVRTFRSHSEAGYRSTPGYLFCAEVMPPEHELQLMLVNSIRKVNVYQSVR